MKHLPSETTTSAWARLMLAQRHALNQAERALKDAGLPALAWYDVLLELDRAGRDGLRPGALERALLLRQYNLSRQIDRMEAAGLVARRPYRDDARGQVLHITAAGRRIRKRMWPVYAAAIETAVGKRLSAAERSELARLLGKLLPSDIAGDGDSP
jgi:DNA-binding MarR family transcriptional regulator